MVIRHDGRGREWICRHRRERHEHYRDHPECRNVIGTLKRDTWHHVDQVVNYSLQTYAVKLDGTTLASGLAFCGNNSGTCNGAMVTAMG